MCSFPQDLLSGLISAESASGPFVEKYGEVLGAFLERASLLVAHLHEFLSGPWYLDLLGFVVWWMIVLSLPGILAWLLIYQLVGRIRFLPNLAVVLLTVFGTCAAASNLHAFMGDLAPFVNAPARFELGFHFLAVVWIVLLWKSVSYRRCPRCHRINAGLSRGSTLLGHHYSDTRYQTKDRNGVITGRGGQLRVRSEFSNHRKCRFCGATWNVRSTRTS